MTKLLGLEPGATYVAIYDTEATGVEEKDRMIQGAFGLYALNTEKKSMKLIKYHEEMINPGDVKINPFAAAVHGFWKEDVKDAPLFKDSMLCKFFAEMVDHGNVYFVAHNAPFDRDMFAKDGLLIPFCRSVDTYKIVGHLLQDVKGMESKALQYMRYFFDFDSMPRFQQMVKEYGINKIVPHTALADVAVLSYLFYALMQKCKFSFNGFIQLAFQPFFEDKVRFGNIFKNGSSIRDALCSTYEQYGRTKQGVEYFNWAIQNMDGLRLDEKVNIAYQTIQCLKEDKLKISNPHLTPMLNLASTFLPESWEYLSDVAKRNPQILRQVTLQNLKDEIEANLNSEDKRIAQNAISSKRELEFLEYYVENFYLMNESVGN